jgi:hypothetical protein
MNGATQNLALWYCLTGLWLRNWLGGKDSNLRYRIQSPGPYRLATAHPELLQEQFKRPGMISAHPLPRALWLPPSATTLWYSAIIFSSIIFRVSLLIG